MTKLAQHDTSKSFYFLLGIVFCLPLPLGSNIAWAWSLFELSIFALSLFLLVKSGTTNRLGILSYSNSLYFWLAFIILAVFQIVPLPPSLLESISPNSFEAYKSVSASSYFISVDPAQSGISFIKLLSYFCLFICVLSLINNEQRIRTLLLVIVASGAFQALYAILEAMLGLEVSLVFSLGIESGSTGSFERQHHFANFLVLCLCAAFGLLVAKIVKVSNKQESTKRSLSIADISQNYAILGSCMALMLIALIMSYSKIGSAAFFISLVVVSATACIAVKGRHQGLVFLLSGAVIANLVIVSMYFGLERLKTRLSQNAYSVADKQDAIQDAYPIVADYPIFGTGSGSFQSIFPSYRVSESAGFNLHLGNDYLQFVIEYGLLGIFILLGLVAFCTYKCVRAMNQRRNSIFKGGAFACLMVFVAMGIHMSADYPLQSYSNGAYFVVFLALSMVINSLKLMPRKPLKNDDQLNTV